MPPNLVNFGPETAKNGWRVFAHPLYFRIGRHCQPYLMDRTLYTDSRHALAHAIVARAYSLEQQNAGRAQDELCHASS